MKILVACEESQRVCTEFRKLGHEAYSCDIEPCSGGHNEWHIQDDVLPLLNGNCDFKTVNGDMHHLIGKWDMIIAFPPCTYFTTSGACRMFHKVNGKSVLDKERFEKAMEMKKLFMAIYNADCEKIAIENPTPMKIIELPKHTQVIQPYMFGHEWSKRTLLWLKGLPELKPTKVVEPTMGSWVNGSAHAYKNKNGKHNGKSSAIDRSKTFPGIAKAMAEQWTEL